jgi:two-component system response regulator (stage 0 sporulation protein F)
MEKKRKVLYLDDEEPNLLLFGITFRNKLEVITVNDAQKALSIIEESDDLEYVISDMRMPHMTGLEFVVAAKNKKPNINYYILSGFDETDDILEAIENGTIKAYLKKPFNKNLILSIFNN